MKDLLLNADYSPVITDGDFELGEPTGQNQTLLLRSQPGEWKQSPEAGVGIEDFIESEDLNLLPGIVTREFEADTMTVFKVALTNGSGGLEVRGGYE